MKEVAREGSDQKDAESCDEDMMETFATGDAFLYFLKLGDFTCFG